MKRFCSLVNHPGMGTPGGGHLVRAEQAYAEVLDAIWHSIEGSSNGAASTPYLLKGYIETRWAPTQAIPSMARTEQVQLGRGLAQVAAFISDQ